MGVSLVRLSSIRATFKYLACITFLCIFNPVTGYADARGNAQALCNQKLGPGGTAVEDFSFGETSYICDCRKAYIWNDAGSACVRRQSDNPADAPDTANQRPPDDDRDPPNTTYDDDPPPQAPRKIYQPRKKKKVKRAPPPRRKKRTVRTKKKKRVARGGAATAHRYCRRRYGRRLVNVRVKRSKFYCHYYGKKAVGYNKRVKWKKFRFRNIR